MYALPGQTLGGALADVAAALAFAPPHLSFYHLTLEPNTLFHRYPAAAAGRGRGRRRCGDMVEARLADAGYEHYEISAYAQPRRRVPAQPQLLAVRRLPRHRRRRAQQALVPRPHRAPDARTSSRASIWRASPRATRCRSVTRSSAGDLGVRVHDERAAPDRRVRVALFAERTGLPLAAVDQPLDEAERRGLIERDHVRIRRRRWAGGS